MWNIVDMSAVEKGGLFLDSEPKYMDNQRDISDAFRLRETPH
jgi:hypothetical protein